MMSVPTGNEIGEETHETIDPMLFLVDGKGEAVLKGQTEPVEERDVIFGPAGTRHTVLNTGYKDLKLFTVYSPPAHPDGTVRDTHEELMETETV